MTYQSDNESVIPVLNLREYFRDSVDAAIVNQGVRMDPHAAHYVVNLLTLFSRSEELFEDTGEQYGLRPLAIMLAEASDAESNDVRTYYLRRIGDVSLFVAGFFSDSLADKPVDIDYYVNMGGSAYCSLSDELRGTAQGSAFCGVFDELGVKFQTVVDVLHEVSDTTAKESDRDLLRLHDIWARTGSKRAASLLRKNGVFPLRANPTGRRH